MNDVFISYSRRDSDFMEKLLGALQARKLDAWVDRSDIYKGEKWLDAIYDGIEGADTFVFIVTPDSLKSEVCNQEIAHARLHNKRIVPIIRREVEQSGALQTEIVTTWYDKPWEQTARDNWNALKSINWLFFRDDDPYDDVINQLVDTLKTDHVHVHQHTQFLTRALRWQTNQRASSFLIVGEELEEAEQWLAASAGKSPEPTELQREYIAESRTVYDRRLQRARRLQQVSIIFGVLTIVAILATLIAGVTAVNAIDEQEQALTIQAEVRLEATEFGVDQAYNQTMVAGLGMVPVRQTPIEAHDVVLTVTTNATNQMELPRFETFDGVEMAYVPTGCTWIGSTASRDEQPIHQFCPPEPFWIDRYEVTNRQFADASGSCTTGDDLPYACITWDEAAAFCAERGARLPTEAEWEYAARGPDSLVFPWGNTFEEAETFLIFDRTPEEGPAPVGGREDGQSWVGAEDMAGNVYEWVDGLYVLYESTDEPDTNQVVFRGGGFTDSTSSAFSASRRNPDVPTFSDVRIGFRCARDF